MQHSREQITKSITGMDKNWGIDSERKWIEYTAEWKTDHSRHIVKRRRDPIPWLNNYLHSLEYRHRAYMGGVYQTPFDRQGITNFVLNLIHQYETSAL